MPLEKPTPPSGIKWHEVTWYSKLGAVILFLGVVPALCFYIGMEYQAVQDATFVPIIEPKTSESKLSVEGLYYRYRGEDKSGELDVISKGPVLHLKIDVGGEPNGAATGGDCQLEAEGTLVGNTLMAKVVPFKGKDTFVTAKFLELYPTEDVTVTFMGDQAVVQTQFHGCGVGTYPIGTFKKHTRSDAQCLPFIASYTPKFDVHSPFAATSSPVYHFNARLQACVGLFGVTYPDHGGESFEKFVANLITGEKLLKGSDDVRYFNDAAYYYVDPTKNNVITDKVQFNQKAQILMTE